MITIPGQLAIKTRNGRYGPFNVGYLATSIGEFVVKDAELDQYDEGKYEGEFIIASIGHRVYHNRGSMIIETRAQLGGMTLSNIESLTKDEANRLAPQEVDPVDEEAQSPTPLSATPTTVAVEGPPNAGPLVDTTPSGAALASAAGDALSTPNPDAALFGTLWPLAEVIKLDATVDRRLLRQQRARLETLGYGFEPRSQQFSLKKAA